MQLPRQFMQRSATTPILILTQIVSLQLGSAVAKRTYTTVAPTTLACMRLIFAAGALWLLVRPGLRGVTARQWRISLLLGLVVAAMNVAYFQAIGHVPIGVAATLELLGPLGLSIVLSRRPEHMAIAVVALAGVLLLTAPGASLSLAGVLLGGLAAIFRASYVVLSRRVGSLFTDWTGLTLALACGACVMVPVAAIGGWGAEVVSHPSVLGPGLLVAVLSSLLPYTLDMTVLRRIDERAFGVLLALSPALGALIGYTLLDEQLTARHVGAMALIMCAGAWSVGRLSKNTEGGHAPSAGGSPDTDEHRQPGRDA